MKAVVKTGFGKGLLDYVDVPKPEPKSDELLVKVMACGICGSDIHIEDDEYTYTIGNPIGHEMTGIVEAVGSEVTKFKVGDQISPFNCLRTCGKCYYCQNGLPFLCDEKQTMGGKLGGAMAEYVTIPEKNAFKVPEEQKGKLSWALCEPAACCVRAVMERTDVNAGDLVLVIGPGNMGLLCLQLLKIQGARVVVLGTEKDRERLALAKKLGAIEVCENVDELHAIKGKYTTHGFDIVFECSGYGPTVQLAVDEVRKGGHITIVAGYGKPAQVNADPILLKEINLSSTFSSEFSSWEKLVKLLEAGKLDLDVMVGEEVPLAEYKRAFQMHRDKATLKILLVP